MYLYKQLINNSCIFDIRECENIDKIHCNNNFSVNIREIKVDRQLYVYIYKKKLFKILSFTCSRIIKSIDIEDKFPNNYTLINFELL